MQKPLRNQTSSQKEKSHISTRLAVVCSVFIAPVGLVWSIIIRLRAKTPQDKLIATRGIVTGAVITPIFLIVLSIGAYFAPGIYMPNLAQDKSQPIERVLIDAGGEKVCTYSFNGYGGVDSQEPSYNVYYIVKDDPDLSTKLQDAAKSIGVTLETNHSSTEATDTATGDTTELVSSDSTTSPHLRVYITHAESAPQYCGNDFSYTRKTFSVPAGDVFVASELWTQDRY